MLGNKPTVPGSGNAYDPKNSYYNNYHKKDATNLPSITPNTNNSGMTPNMPGSKGSSYAYRNKSLPPGAGGGAAKYTPGGMSGAGDSAGGMGSYN